MKPILIISDTHYHNFSQYSSLDSQGRNTRLMDTLRATGEAVRALIKAGGDTVIHGGDMFHVRGNVSPTVLNPVLDFYGKLVKSGLKVYVISGNHDLETNDASELASTVSALQNVGVTVINAEQTIMINGDLFKFVPWVNKLADLRAIIKAGSGATGVPSIARRNLVIHAPMNGVIDGLPDHGLSPKDFDDTDWDNVFCGHYHNHKMFQANGGDTYIYSIGALTHQNWGDTESRAGYLLYYPEKMGKVEQHETFAPRFTKVDIADVATADVLDDYVKVTGGDFEDPADIETIRNDLILRGAKAVIVEGLVKRPAVTRSGSTVSGTPTLQSILGDYVDRNYPGEPEVKLVALEILGEVYD